MYKVISYLFLITVVFGRNEDYKGYKVYDVHITSQSQQNALHMLKSDMIDFWRKPSLKYNVTGKAMVPPSHFDFFESKLQELNIPLNVFVEDVYEYLNEKDNIHRISKNTEDEYLNRYLRYDEILDHLRALEGISLGANNNIEVVEYGVTDENRPLVYLKLTNANERPVIIIEAGINPREWITIPSSLYIIEKLLDVDNFNLLNAFDWIFVPVLNPDGYEYTHTNLRLWSKSRSTRSNLGFICPGVNIDRNFDTDWLHFDSSSSPCSHLYAGVEPFSEPETKLIQHLLDEYGSRVQTYVSLQNSGGFITYPWNYERAASGMFRQNHLLGLDMAASMKEHYELDAGAIVFDRSSGTSSDYARDKNVLYTYTIGLAKRDGVIIPASEIRDIAEDAWFAVQTAAESLIELNN